MKITMVVATSQDGFINRLHDKHAYDWTSKEDQKHYSDILAKYKLQLMGSKTYEAYRDVMKITGLHRRIILTRSPQEYSAIPGKLEFTDEPFKKLLERLQTEGFKHALLLGGGQIFAQFLNAGLIGEAYQTIEPKTFGEGVPFLPDGKTLKDFPYLEFEDSTVLNEQGTILLHYIHV